jgi:hypothetical protein
MSEPEDTWPEPNYNPGSPKHLHALGVISVTYCAFEQGIHNLCELHPQKQKIPRPLANFLFYSLNDDKKIAAIRAVFRAYERDRKVLGVVKNLLEYFNWCRDARNKLLHAERYPPLFGGDEETLHLTKLEGKTKPKRLYVALKLPFLRGVADKIRLGQVQCARVRIYLRVRDVPLSELPHGYVVYKRDPLPGILHVPQPLKLFPSPQTSL